MRIDQAGNDPLIAQADDLCALGHVLDQFLDHAIPDDQRNETFRVQTWRVRDTLPPIIEPPGGRVEESAQTTATLKLGKPAVFDLADPARVELSVFDPRGHRVAVLHRGPVDAGPFSAAWDGRDDGGRAVPAGLYLFRLAAVGETGWTPVVTKGILLE